MAVEFDGGVVMGRFVSNRVSNKLTPVHERIYCCRSGSAADTQAISDFVSYYLNLHSADIDDLPSVKTAARLFEQLCYRNPQLLAGIICAGWDEKRGGQVYTVPLQGMVTRQPFSIGGSGSSYIYGYCDATFREGMSREECIKFVQNSVALAMSRDGSSGGVIRIIVIDKNGVERSMLPGNQLPRFYEGK